MINYTLSFKIPKSNIKINHQDELVLIGSCFSDEIAKKLEYNGFKAYSNPFGTIFHPLCLSQLIRESFESNNIENIINRDDVYLSWDASSTIFEYSETNLSNKLTLIRKEFTEKIKKSKLIIITFGTSWGYKLIKNNKLVANCHKFDQKIFKKEISSIHEIVQSWNETIQLIKKVNPSISICFTVSPVRHIRDGLIENNQSKAILIEAIRQINEKNSTNYFPSYEILIDELRDYRFYKTDKTHPSDEAIEYVWSKFSEVYFDENTLSLCNEVTTLKRQLSHNYIHPNSIETINAIEKLKIKLHNFQLKNPTIIL